jgi:chemotaxis signal transduction protein
MSPIAVPKYATVSYNIEQLNTFIIELKSYLISTSRVRQINYFSKFTRLPKQLNMIISTTHPLITKDVDN